MHVNYGLIVLIVNATSYTIAFFVPAGELSTSLAIRWLKYGSQVADICAATALWCFFVWSVMVISVYQVSQLSTDTCATTFAPLSIEQTMSSCSSWESAFGLHSYTFDR